ncbi:MAG TPA: hypothetical protein VEM57_03875 [Candidatus Binatus sp.]|nr:hypothetical protein [Candidatus Binatus sp.]
MRIVIVGLLAVLLAAETPLAASILYATAATAGRVDGFCLRGDGFLAPTPRLHVDTAGAQPRRLLIANDVLYVAEVDRLEAFPIGGAGTLKTPTRTKATVGLDPRDMALSPDGRTLYATHHSYVSAWALGADGSIPEEFTSCVQGGTAADYLDVQVANGLLYVSADDVPGRIEVYRLAADGSLPQTGCGAATDKNRPAPPKWPDSVRTRIQNPKAIIVVGDMIYVEERALRRMIAFRLQPDGTFCDKKRNRTDKNDTFFEDCTGFDPLASRACARLQAKAQAKGKRRQQCIASQTAEVLQYEGLALHPNGETLIGAQFFKGRVDSYRLRPDTRLPAAPRSKLPRQPSAESEPDPRMTPVRLAVQGNTVYVAAGELDRVVAYHLTPTGVLAEKKPFSRTDEQKDSFPNDVAISMLSAACE